MTENEAFYWEEEIIRQLVFGYGYSIDIPNNRSNEKGYHLVNMTWGGEGTSGINPFENKTEEEMNEISKKISEANSGENHPLYGKHLLEETRRKMSKNHADFKGKNNGKAKSVICLTTKRIFYTATEGARYYNMKNSGDISRCCKGKRKSCGKYKSQKLVWKYLVWDHNKRFRII